MSAALALTLILLTQTKNDGTDVKTPPAPAADTTTVWASMVTATSVKDTLPFGVFSGTEFRPDPKAEFVKVHMHFDWEVKISRVEVTSCAGAFKVPVITYINFDENVVQLPANAETTGQDLPEGTKVRSLTMNFGKNNPLCIKAVRLFDKNKKPLTVRTPTLVKGTIAASDTLEPVASYNVANLFDSRFEYAWSSNKKAKGSTLTLSFEEPQTITHFRIWNGYQRSDTHCIANSRVKTLELSDDAGYKVKLELADATGSQKIALPKPWTGKSLKILVAEAYNGKSYKDLAISELRWANNLEWYMFDPRPTIHATSAATHEAFTKAGLDELLDKSLEGTMVDSRKDGGWTLRLRSDQSFFMEGYTSLTRDDGSQTNKTFFALGNHEAKPQPDGTLALRVFGVLRVVTENYEEIGMDCNGCGRDCNGGEDPDATERLFENNLVLKKEGDSYVVDNVSKKRKLEFKKLKLRLE